MPICSLQEWKSFIRDCQDPHILQSPVWGELKSRFGWNPIHIINGNIGAQILFQNLPLGYRIAYIPKGPITTSNDQSPDEAWEAFQQDLDDICREQRAVFLKIEPDFWQGDPTGRSLFGGYHLSGHHIQPPRTILVNLADPEEKILARMKSKTRYNIRLAEKKGVIIRQLDDVEPFYQLLLNTADRSEFGIHTREYYLAVFDLFQPSGACQLFLAEFQDQPLASIMVFKSGQRSWYFYGASSNLHRDKMPTYLIQWEAMRWAKHQGCISYDLWGVPDEDEPLLEENFLERQDGLWGVYRFKRGFGGQLKRSDGPWDRIYHPPLYSLYQLYTRVASYRL
jgi:lipid II:glycine glycyltransferase (peptidoglycan interpeptide bridge formation enzyme)